MKHMSLIRSIGVNFKHLFKKPFTVMYPDKKKGKFPRGGGSGALP
jgi:formate hydrogenlyase subunit 6/NADH:ubiquinone oxidoreductase subunit I